MSADLMSAARSFVAALVSDSAARDAFWAAAHPVDVAQMAAVISQYGAPIDAADVPAIEPLIATLLAQARASGASSLSGNIMPGDTGGTSGSIMPVDAGGAPGSIMTGDKDSTS